MSHIYLKNTNKKKYFRYKQIQSSLRYLFSNNWYFWVEISEEPVSWGCHLQIAVAEQLIVTKKKKKKRVHLHCPSQNSAGRGLQENQFAD